MDYDAIGNDAAGKRTAQRLLALRAQLREEERVPPKSFEHVLLATWNIREFDSPAYGPRSQESFYYIAEILSQFDLVAVQEVREDLRALERVREIMGPWWKYLVTDVTEGRQGNRERMAFLYDSRQVRLGGVAGEIVIPPVEKRVPGGRKIEYHPARQLVRTPFLCGFRAGWSRFMLCTVHILYGESAAEDPERVEEIRMIAKFLASRAGEKSAWSKNLILLGDFNIFSEDDATMRAIIDAGFEVPEELQNLPSNIGGKKRHYDQIAFIPKRERLETTGLAGVLDYYRSVFKDDDETIYASQMGESYLRKRSGEPRDAAGKRRYYRTYWRTHQMSDHLPMWVQLKVDFGEEYLEDKTR